MSRLATVCLVLCLVVLWAAMLSAAPAPAPKVPKELLQARLKAARATYKQLEQQLQAGNCRPSELFGWSRRWLDAQLPQCADKAERLAAYQDHVQRTRQEEQRFQAFVRAGQAKQSDRSAAAFHRIEAEILLLEAGGQLPGQDKPSAPKEGEASPLPKPEKKPS